MSTHNDKEVSVCASEDRHVHGHPHSVGLVEAHPKVALPTQQQQNEHPNVHQANTR